MINKAIASKFQKAKYLISNTILKMKYRAELNETNDSKSEYLLYKAAYTKTDTIYSYEVGRNILLRFAPNLTNQEVEGLLYGTYKYENYLTGDELLNLLTYYRQERMDSYEELNNYYRMLMGLPPYGENPSEFIYVTGYDKPIHELTNNQIYRLEKTKQLDLIITQNPEKQYLFYLNKRIDFRIAREAGEFEILYSPTGTDYALYRSYVNKERQTYFRMFCLEGLLRGTDYQEATDMAALKLRAFIYYHIEAENNTKLNKSEYTHEQARVKWEEYGYSLPKNMPSLYRDSITFLLEYLTIYKGTNHVVKFLCDEIFTGLKLYNYKIRRRLKEGIQFPVDPETPAWEVYDIDFILRPIYATNIVDFAEDNTADKILSYEDIVNMDPRFRSTLDVKKAIFEHKFSYTDSKYLSLDNYVNLSKLTDEMSLISRIFTENKSLLENVSITYSGTGIIHNFFNFFIYYMAIFHYVMNRMYDGKIPDTLLKIKRMYGFRVPENMEKFKDEFLWYLTRHNYNEFLNKFPNILNDTNDFFELLLNLDKAIDILPMFHDMIQKSHNFKEYDFLADMYKSIRIVNTSPNSFDMNIGSIDGKTYVEYLEENDPDLYDRYQYILKDNTYELLENEIDNASIEIENFIDEYTTNESNLNNVKHSFSYFSIYVNGVSKHLLYILKIFKSYQSDILTEDNIYQLTSKYNYTLTIDQMRIITQGKIKERLNMSCHDYINFNKKSKILDLHTTVCQMIYRSTYGDIIIS